MAIKKAVDMHLEKPKFDWSINFGQVMQLATLLSGFTGILIFMAGERAEIKRDLQTSLEARTKYIPIIENLSLSDAVQNDRILGLSDTARDIRKTNGEMLLVLGTIREDVAGMKAKLSITR